MHLYFVSERVIDLALEAKSHPSSFRIGEFVATKRSSYFQQLLVSLRKMGECGRELFLRDVLPVFMDTGRIEELDQEESAHLMALACYADEELSEIIWWLDARIIRRAGFLN